MRLTLACVHCAMDREHYTPKAYAVGVTESGVYSFTCSAGHHMRIQVQEQKFEILFEIAVNAIVDGYYREAVVSAASALERFYEFAVSVLTAAAGSDETAKAWKCVASQSERQLGMFIGCHVMHFGVSPSIMDPKPKHSLGTEFRNSVVHKGKIPSRNESLTFAREVVGLIEPLMEKLKSSFPAEIREIVLNTMAQRSLVEPSSIADKGHFNGSCNSPTFLSLAMAASTPRRSIEDYLECLENVRAERIHFGIGKLE